MTLRMPEPTEASVEIVRSHLSALAGRTAFHHRALTRANPAGLALAAPHDVYFLSLSDLAGGAFLEAARAVGRRFIVMDGSKPVASAELADDLRGSGFQASEGQLVDSTAAAIDRPAPFEPGRKYAPAEIRSPLAEAARAHVALDDDEPPA